MGYKLEHFEYFSSAFSNIVQINLEMFCTIYFEIKTCSQQSYVLCLENWNIKIEDREELRSVKLFPISERSLI